MLEAIGGQVHMHDQDRQQMLADAAETLGIQDDFGREILGQLWDAGFEYGRLAALDELQDRFCVCMK